MSKIILDVNDSDLATVLTILKNLKSGMIKNIETNNSNISKSKYLSKDNYKEKLSSNKVLEDEFLAKKTISSKRYLSPNEYKNRLKGIK